MPDDHNGLRSIYGMRPLPVERQFESWNLASGIVELSMADVNAASYFGASTHTTLTPTTVTLVGYRRNVGTSPIVYQWDWPTLALTSLGEPTGHSANGPLAAAQSSSHRVVASSTYRMTSDARRWRRRVTTSNRTIPGSTWSLLQSNPGVGTIGDTVTGGISAAYNPSQAAMLYAYRSTDGHILLQAGTSGTPHNTGVISDGTPSIACTSVGTLNCIAVSIEPGRPITTSTLPRLRWFKFSWNSVTGWTLGSLFTTSWVVTGGDPQVSAYWNGTNWEYTVFFQTQAPIVTWMHLLRMDVSGTSFSYWGSVSSEPGVTTTANGATRDLELFTFRY